MATGRTEPPGRVRMDATLPLWQGTALLRVVTYFFAVGVAAVHYADYARRDLVLVVLAAMALWTAGTVAGYLRRPRGLGALVLADVLVTCGLMGTSVLILSPEQFAAGLPLITTVWSAATPVAAGVLAGPTAGAATGLLVAAATALSRGEVGTSVAIDAVLLISSGFIVGAASHTARRSAERLASALRIEAATAERERLARSIHDGVLQVLAGVRRRSQDLGGNELDGPAGELARLAGDQEIALRSLIASNPAEPGFESGSDGEQDLGARLQVLASRAVQVSLPATRVRLPGHTVEELTAAVGEALANAREHAGEGARTWLLLEDLPESVVITVRDDGVGIPAGRLAAAEDEGRLGVAQSMRARIAALGGSLHLETAPEEGTEWEMTLPKPTRPKR